MTLVIAWRESDTDIRVASDSRLLFGGAGFRSDTGVKILDLEVRIHGVLDPGGSPLEQPPAFHGTIGAAVAGSVAIMHNAHAALRQVARDLQAVPGWTTISIESIASMAAGFLRTIAQSVALVVGPTSGGGAMPLLGFCPHAQRARAFRLDVEFSDTGVAGVTPREVLVEQRVELMGCGARAAQSVIDSSQLAIRPLHVLKAVIEDAAVPEVGGPVQYGDLTAPGHGFSVKSVWDYAVDHETREFSHAPYCCGARIDPINSSSLFLMVAALDPFRQEINDLLEKGYSVRE